MEEENQISDEEQQQEINANRKKINLSLVVAVVALAISAIQLIFTSPYFMDSYNKPTIEVYERDGHLSRDSTTVTFVYEIYNSSHKPAEEVSLRFRCFDDDKIQFMPAEATKIREDEEGIPIRNFTYKIDNLVPDERYILFIYSDAEKLKDYMNIDALQVGEDYRKPELFIGPYLEMAKSKKGFASIYRKETLKLSFIEYRDLE